MRESFKWISEPDKGIYDAMNKGIRLATGDVVGILNSDDFYTSVSVLSKVAEEVTDVEAVYGDIHFVNDSDLNEVRALLFFCRIFSVEDEDGFYA